MTKKEIIQMIKILWKIYWKKERLETLKDFRETMPEGRKRQRKTDKINQKIFEVVELQNKFKELALGMPLMKI